MRRAFTLVELMIVVAIIGILASIAIPNFVEMQYRAKRAELPVNVRGIKDYQRSYEAENNNYLPVTAHPTGTPGKQPQEWGAGNSGYQLLGWSPDGKVRGQYEVVTTVSSASAPAGDFVVTGVCDVDANGDQATYTATKSINAVMTTTNDTY
jgi:prepilin-type N-terminal cleavage/methylation domain-containing protein